MFNLGFTLFVDYCPCVGAIIEKNFVWHTYEEVY